jgi:hypothetical protein
MWLRRVVDAAFAQEREAGAAVHLPLDHFDLFDVAFYGGGAPVQGEAGGDGLLVAADAVGEGANRPTVFLSRPRMPAASRWERPSRKSSRTAAWRSRVRALRFPRKLASA